VEAKLQVVNYTTIVEGEIIMVMNIEEREKIFLLQFLFLVVIKLSYGLSDFVFALWPQNDEYNKV